MRRLFHGLIAAGLLAAPYANAACPSPTDETIFELQGLKSELMVLATGCQGKDGDYNAFVNKFKAALGANDAAFAAYFRRAFGKSGQREQDAYVTNLANAQSQAGMHLGSEFCPRNAAIFREVMALRGPGDLPSFVAAKDLIPDELGSCTNTRGNVVKAVATQRKKATH
jgi:hypothetical protein